MFFGKFSSYVFAFKLIENDATLFYYRGCTLNETFTIQVYSYDLQYTLNAIMLILINLMLGKVFSYS